MQRVVLVLLVITLMTIPHAFGQGDDPVIAGSQWLISQQEENGSFGDEIGATSLTIMAFATAEETNEAALAWLESQVAEDLVISEVALMVSAVVASGADIGTFADGTLLATYTRLLRETTGESMDGLCLGLIARLNLDLPLPDESVEILLDGQKSGFSVNPETDPDVITTSLCIHVLAATSETQALIDALAFLKNIQLEDDGWSIDPTATTSDPLATAFATQALLAADEVLTDWGSPERTLILFQNTETGAFEFGDGGDNFLNLISTAVAIPVFRGKSISSFGQALETIETDSNTDGPALDQNWKLVGDGFHMAELDTADDFFVTVVDPFTADELYGIEIINWTAEYQYTGYIVEQYLTAEILLWLAEQDPSVWENISDTTLNLLPVEVLSQLPSEIQSRVSQ